MSVLNVPSSESNIFKDSVWNFSANNRLLSNALELREDGSLHGYRHPNEKAWQFTEGGISFMGINGEVTGRLDRIESENGSIEYIGPSMRNSKVIFRLQQVNWNSRVHYEQETCRLLASDIAKYGWEIGEHTYGRPKVHERLAKLKIGKFCSIASDVEIALGNHRIDSVSSYPFFALNRFWPSAFDRNDHTTRGDVVIGNDVWIAASAFIGSGVSVGNGAVIGAHAVVSRDVPPYAIVAGNPASVVRYRFEQNIIDELLDIAWWDWPDEKIDRFLALMFGPDIGEFITAANAAR